MVWGQKRTAGSLPTHTTLTHTVRLANIADDLNLSSVFVDLQNENLCWIACN